MTARFEIRLSQERRAEIEQLARQLDTTSSELARIGLIWVLANQQTLLGKNIKLVPPELPQKRELRSATPARGSVLTVEEAAKVLRISRASAYSAVRDRSLPTVKIGRRYLVPRVALERLLNGE